MSGGIRDRTEALERDDGRNIDPSLGELRGEGAMIRVESPEHGYPTSREIARRPRSEAAEQPTYYHQPVIKAPVWIWSVPLYLFVGGLAGASAALAATARALDPGGLRRLIRPAHAVSLSGDMLGACLLIYDLGRPARFLNMLRVFRPTSPMSIGSWLLSASGVTSALTVLFDGRARGGVLGRIGAVASYASGLFGLPLAGYTAVLLTNTAVPVWQGGRRMLPPLFLTSSAASAGALLGLFGIGRRGRAVARRFALLGGAAELALGFAFELEVGRSPHVARPLRDGVSGALWSLSRALIGASLLASLAARRDRRRIHALAGILGLSGALVLRAAVFLAGKASARDPRATFRQQRDGFGAAEVTRAR